MTALRNRGVRHPGHVVQCWTIAGIDTLRSPRLFKSPTR